MHVCAIDFIFSVALAFIILSEDDFDKLDKHYFIIYALFAFALLEVITGFMAYKREYEDENVNGTVVSNSNHGMTNIETPTPSAPAVIYSDKKMRS